MKRTIGRVELTNEHPLCRNGAPVMIMDGGVYGCMDRIDEFFAGSHMVCSDAVTMERLDPVALEMLIHWLLESGTLGHSWVGRVIDSQRTRWAEMPDEGKVKP